GIQNPDGGLHTLAYDTGHRLTDDRLATLRTTYAYSSGAEAGFTEGDASTDSSAGRSTLSPAALAGLSALAAGPVWATGTDPLGRVTREQLDASGRPLVAVAPDGGATQYTRDGNGWVTKVTDPLGRVTTYTLDTAGYPTQEALPDGSLRTYTYQSAFHAL